MCEKCWVAAVRHAGETRKILARLGIRVTETRALELTLLLESHNQLGRLADMFELGADDGEEWKHGEGGHDAT